MKATQSNDISVARLAFIETLSDEFTASNGYGVYAFLSPPDINHLFTQYLKHGNSLREFARTYVRKCLRL